MMSTITYVAEKHGRILKESLACEINREIEKLIVVGFDNPLGYRKNVWCNAKKTMEIACVDGVVFPLSNEQGKGKYSTNLSLKEVVALMQANDKVIEIAIRSLNLDIGSFPKVPERSFVFSLERG